MQCGKCGGEMVLKRPLVAVEGGQPVGYATFTVWCCDQCGNMELPPDQIMRQAQAPTLPGLGEEKV